MGLFSKKKIKVNNEYIKQLDESGIFENKHKDSFPQTVVSKIIADHFKKNTGRKNRALIMGFDGARADSMLCVLKGKDEKISGFNSDSRYSAIKLLKEEGGLYLSYAGGDEGCLQETSTAQGWASILTGKWGVENGVIDHVPLKKEFPTVLLQLAREGVTASFNASWPDHFTITYSEEIKTAKAENVPLSFNQVKDDEPLHEQIIKDIENGTECIFAIYEAPDHNGHSTGFGNGNYRYVVGVTDLDRMAFEQIERVKAREEYKDENWLFIITSDHGGHNHGHGMQMTEDRETFIAVNKEIEY